MAPYGSAEWYEEVDERIFAHELALLPKVIEVMRKQGLRDHEGKLTAKRLSVAEHATLVAELLSLDRP